MAKVKWIAKRRFIHPVTGICYNQGDQGVDEEKDVRAIKNLLTIKRLGGSSESKGRGKGLAGPEVNKAVGAPIETK